MISWGIFGLVEEDKTQVLLTQEETTNFSMQTKRPMSLPSRHRPLIKSPRACPFLLYQLSVRFSAKGRNGTETTQTLPNVLSSGKLKLIISVSVSQQAMHKFCFYVFYPFHCFIIEYSLTPLVSHQK